MCHAGTLGSLTDEDVELMFGVLLGIRRDVRTIIAALSDEDDDGSEEEEED